MRLDTSLSKLSIIGPLLLLLAACGTRTPTVDRSLGVAPSPRVVAEGQPIPRGGGRAVVGIPYTIGGRTFVPRHDPNYSSVGIASWYGDAFHGRLTANGEVFDRDALSAAHPTMPLPSYARVTNLENGRSVVLRVNDRGPFAGGERTIDVSRRAAEVLDFRHDGLARVEVAYLAPAPLSGSDDRVLMASLRTDGRPAEFPDARTRIADGTVAPAGRVAAYASGPRPESFAAPGLASPRPATPSLAVPGVDVGRGVPLALSAPLSDVSSGVY